MGARNQRVIKSLQHSITQCLKRYGDLYTHSDIIQMSRKIADGEAKCIRDCDDIKTVYTVQYNGKTYKVGYCKDLKLITTFLPYPSGRMFRDIVKIKRWK